MILTNFPTIAAFLNSHKRIIIQQTKNDGLTRSSFCQLQQQDFLYNLFINIQIRYTNISYFIVNIIQKPKLDVLVENWKVETITSHKGIFFDR